MRSMSQQSLGPQAPGWAAQENGKERLWLPEEWGSICCSSVQSPTHLSHNNTFRNPFEPFQRKWEVYFSKELCPLVFIVLTMFPCIVAYVLCGYTTFVNTEFNYTLLKPNNSFTRISYLPKPSARAGYDTRSIFKAKFSWFEFRVFLLLD